MSQLVIELPKSTIEAPIYYVFYEQPFYLTLVDVICQDLIMKCKMLICIPEFDGCVILTLTSEESEESDCVHSPGATTDVMKL